MSRGWVPALGGCDTFVGLFKFSISRCVIMYQKAYSYSCHRVQSVMYNYSRLHQMLHDLRVIVDMYRESTAYRSS